jgi:hypothetical protein
VDIVIVLDHVVDKQYEPLVTEMAAREMRPEVVRIPNKIKSHIGLAVLDEFEERFGHEDCECEPGSWHISWLTKRDDELSKKFLERLIKGSSLEDVKAVVSPPDRTGSGWLSTLQRILPHEPAKYTVVSSTREAWLEGQGEFGKVLISL